MTLKKEVETNLTAIVLSTTRNNRVFLKSYMSSYCIDYLRVYLLILSMSFTPVYADSHHPEEFLKSIKGTKNEGKQIYSHFCANCHAQNPLIHLGAPRIGEASDWKLRLKQEIEILFKHTDEGMNGMPPRGGCFECSDDQLMLAIVEIIPEHNKKDVLNKLKAYKKSR